MAAITHENFIAENWKYLLAAAVLHVAIAALFAVAVHSTRQTIAPGQLAIKAVVIDHTAQRLKREKEKAEADRLAREQAAAALAFAPRGIFTQLLAGVTLAISGQADQALALADDLGKRFPQNTMVNAVAVPIIRASVELERGNATAAIELLKSAKPYEYGEGFLSFYIRGNAHLRTGAGREAAAEFQKILDHRGVSWFWPVVYPLAQLGLARAHALAGDLAQSRKAYQDFFALWKDADPDIPILQQAKAEYAKLN